ncbi:RagB/SusD family nutrient uptake outer membrane protein [Paludibacter sp.]
MEENPTTSLDRKAVFSSEESVRAALLGCYNQFASNTYRGNLYDLNNSIILSSPLSTTSNGVALGVLDELTPKNSRQLPDFFAQAYTAIEHINVFLENIADSPIDEQARVEDIAEARFLRAVIYFDLARAFGRVPLKLTATTVEDKGNTKRASIHDVYEQILADFDYAEQHMKDKNEQLIGFPHKYAATAYLVKVYVQMACLTDAHIEAANDRGKIGENGYIGSANEFRLSLIPEALRSNYTLTESSKYFWEQARDNSELIINNNIYKLQTPFGKLWRGRSRNTEESILEMQYSATFATGTTISARTSPYARTEFNPMMLNNATSARVTVDFATFGRHWQKYGSDAKRSSVTMISKSNEADADPRFNETYVYFSYNGFTQDANGDYVNPAVRICFPQSGFRPDQRFSTFTYIKKHLDSLQIAATYSNLNFIVYRYADLMLLYAESLNELGRTNDAINVVNTTILDRARRSGTFSAGQTPQPANWEIGMGKEEFRDAIMEEREYELLGEGHETFDVRRRGVEYLQKRIDIHDEWYEFVQSDAHWLYTSPVRYPYMRPEVHVYHRIYKDYDPYKNDPERFCKKHLFFPIPQKEINLNNEIAFDDQNFGW